MEKVGAIGSSGMGTGMQGGQLPVRDVVRSSADGGGEPQRPADRLLLDSNDGWPVRPGGTVEWFRTHWVRFNV